MQSRLPNWSILAMEFQKAVRALLQEAVLLSLQKYIYCNNFVNIVKLSKFAIKFLLACSSYSATLRMTNYPASPVPEFTADLLVVNCVQLPHPHRIISIEITSEHKLYLHSPLMSAAGIVIFNRPGCPQNTHIIAAIIL